MRFCNIPHTSILHFIQKYKLAILAVLFFFIYSLPAFWPEAHNGADVGVNVYFTRLYAETNKIAYEDPLNELTAWGAHDRNARSIQNMVIPHNFIGIIIITGFFVRIIPNILFFIVPLFGVLLVLTTYALLKDLFGESFANTSAIVLFVFAPVWRYSSIFVSNLPSVTFFIAGIYFFNKTLAHKEKYGYAALCGLFWGASALIRYTDIIFISVTMLITMLIHYKTFFKKEVLAKIAIIALIAAVITLPLLIYQKQFFDNPLTVAMFPNVGSQYSPFTQNLIKLRTYLLPNARQPDIMTSTIPRYLVQLFFPLISFSLAGLYLAWKHPARQKHKELCTFLLIYIIYLIIFFSNGKYHGYAFSIPSIAASYVRYWIFWYIIALIAAIYAITRIPSRIIRISLMSVLIASNIYVSVSDNTDGIIGIYRSTKMQQAYEADIIARTELTAVIFSVDPDNSVFPDRSIVSYPNAPQFRFSPSTMAALMCNVINEHLPVYLIRGKGVFTYHSSKRLDSPLESICQHRFVKISDTGGGMYKAVPT